MGEDEEAALRTLTSSRKLIDSSIEQHRGRFVNSAGDSVLAEFASVVEAVNCAVEIQTTLKSENANRPPARRMEFRIGVNLGDVMVEGEQIYGDGVNVAARLESLADPGGICVSGTVYEQVRDKLTLSSEDRGEQTVKNIARPVHVWRVLFDGTVAAPSRFHDKYWRGGALSLAGLAIIVAVFVLVQHVSPRAPRTSASIPPPEKPALALPSIPSIAVLPFTNLSGDPQQEYFSDGIANQLIEDLSRLPGLFVIARNSSFAYKGRMINEHEIGRELGVKYVLEGNVRRAAGQIRIGVELVDAGTAAEKWTARYDRPLNDIFAVQDDIVSRVVTTLGLILKLDEMKVSRGTSFRPTNNLEAYDDVLRGAEYKFRETKDDNEKARQWVEKAIELDPGFSEAYSFLGWINFAQAWDQWGANPQGDLEHASELAHKALSLDDSNTDALGLLSSIHWMQRRFHEAVADGQRAVTLNPNYAAGYEALSDALVIDVEPEEALRAAQAAIRLDPADQDLYGYMLGNAYNELGQYQDAMMVLRRTIAVYPNLLVAHLAMIVACAELGRDRDARAEAAEVMRISPHFELASLQGLKNVILHKNFDADWRQAGLK